MGAVQHTSAREPGASMKTKVIRIMHDVLRQRLLRRLESLPEAQLYQVLDYVEFLESKYGETVSAEASGLQRLAENLEDRMRKKAMNPATLREAFQVIAAADRVLAGVSNAGKQLLNELVPEEDAGAPPPRGSGGTPRRGSSPSPPRGSSADQRGGSGPTDRPSSPGRSATGGPSRSGRERGTDGDA